MHAQAVNDRSGSGGIILIPPLPAVQPSTVTARVTDQNIWLFFCLLFLDRFTKPEVSEINEKTFLFILDSYLTVKSSIFTKGRNMPTK